MGISAGYNSKVELTGTAVSFVGEAVSTSDDTTYQITDTAKQVLDRTATISVHKQSSTGNAAEAGTTTTNVTITGHGLVTGDLIVNTTRSNAKRIITKVDDDNFTVAAVTSQTSTDSIDFYPTESASSYTLNRLFGKVTYGSSTSRTILISGSYLPLVEVAQAKETEFTLTSGTEDVTVFGDTWVKKAYTINDFSASISDFYQDDTFREYIVDKELKVYTYYINRASTSYLRAWVIVNSDSVSSSPDKYIAESLEFSGVVDADGRSVSLNT
jgi:hypothetical protein